MATLQIFQHTENVKISILSLYTVLAEMLYFQKVFNEFSKNFFLPERWWSLLPWVENLRGLRRLMVLLYGNFKTFPTSWKCKNFNSSIYTVLVEMLYLQKVFNEFSKSFFRLKDDEGGYCEWKVQGLRYFSFAMATLQIFQHTENVKISILPFTLSRQKCYIFESI